MQVKNKQSGFTLIELLVVVSILAVIATAVYSTIAAGVKIWKRVEKISEGNGLIFTWEKLHKDIRNTFSFEGIRFLGVENEVSFPGLVPVTGADGTVHKEVGRIRYHFEKAKGRICSEKTSYPELLKGIEQECFKEVANITGAVFSYFGPVVDAETELYDWLPRWDDTSPPMAIRMNVTLAEKNEKKFIILLP